MDLEEIKKLTRDASDIKFLDRDIHLRAKKDFKYLCTQAGYNTFNNLNLQSIKKADSNEKYLGEALVLGFDVKDKMLTFPMEFLDIEKPNHFVGVVVYDGKAIKDVFLFNAGGFKKAGLFSMFKVLKKSGEYGIAIKDADNYKMKNYSFGYVLNNLV